MSSSESKVRRLREARLRRAKSLASIDTCNGTESPPPGAILADHSELVHNNTYGALPRFYVDKVVVCRNCGTEEVWPAERQKWWYEVAKGSINSEAVLCRSCRDREKKRKADARRAHFEGVARKAARK
jgi:hypothetical protein